MNEKQKYTTEFETVLNKVVDELQKYVSTETGEWRIKDFIDVCV
jgi:protein associated with RNAse G/E